MIIVMKVIDSKELEILKEGRGCFIEENEGY